ncbi:PREDICTED: protein O-linked-mannose beta-1,2-N-acetylglucosaminyltransferase 1-like [Acropora digitifera]|uniref:protein O-linked-mannose beta-1,2-N-acetylglucosaminyltransferase 1-like n=1 Tax=Acropora digitifera TaxID=70779 RepID=UPI00077A41B2|nr:PREDICTED: protein O-linked-mannose beta-1,2-N-acetylglucosaminyltransferase 1-like [Acropora digitifera]
MLNESSFEGNMDIEVYSSKEKAAIKVDGKMVSEVIKEGVRGIIAFVLNQKTGVLMATREFDTYASSEDGQEVIKFIESLKEGRIVCLAIKDEGTMSLKSESRDQIVEKLGSSYIKDLGWRDTWVLIFKRTNNYKKTIAESHQKSAGFNSWAKGVLLRASITREPEETDCNWEDNESTRRRIEFCEKYEGYEGVCRCHDPVSIDFNPPALEDGSRIDLPVIVMAGNRPHYLYRMLKTLRGVQGLNPSMVTVFIDGFLDEPASVTRVFGLRADQHASVSSKNSRICQHYKKSLTASFDRYPDANYLVILEEDLDVSVDILSYFHQLLPVLENDESLYCISAWNDQGYTHTAKDPAMMYRVETMPGLGWVLSRKLYKDELEAKWPGPDVFWDWDMWMRYRENRKGRECIIPDLSRTYHFGARGLNMNSFMQDVYFTSHAINTQPNVKLNVDVMYKDNYEKELERLLRQAEVLDHSKTPCSNRKDFVPFTKNKTYVLYIRMDHGSDWITWQNVARCLKIWDLDPRGYHKSLWRMWFNENHVLIVGCPASPHCGHKPAEITPVSIQNEEKRILH